MNKRMHHTPLHREAGLSLIELLLSVGVGAVIIMGATQIAQDWAERVRNREEASYMIRISQAAQSYVEANFGEIMQTGFNENLGDTDGNGTIDNNDLVNIGKAIMIPIEDGGGTFYLKDGSVALGANFPVTTPSGRAIQVYVRNLGFIGDQRTLEVLTVTTASGPAGLRRQDELDIRDIGQAIGPEAGVFTSASGSCAGGVFQSLYGSWTLNNSLLTGGSRMMPGSADYCPALDADDHLTAYLAVQGRATYESATSNDYLYRVAIPGAPEANRMTTNINMGGHSIMNAANMSVDNLIVNGDADINAPTGTTSLFVDEGLRVAGTGSHINVKGDDTDPLDADCYFTGPSDSKVLNPAASGGCGTVGGDLIVRGTASTAGYDSVEISSLQAGSASLTAPIIEVEGGMTVGGNLGVNNNIAIGGTLTSGQVVAPTTVIGNQLTTTELQVAGATTTNSVSAGLLTTEVLQTNTTLNATSLQVVYDMGVGGNVALSGGLSADQFQATGIDGCTATVMHTYPWTDDSFVTTAPYDCTGDGPN